MRGGEIGPVHGPPGGCSQRILIGVPCGDMMFSLTAQHLAYLLAYSRACGVEAELMLNMGSMAVNNRSTLAMQAREHSFDKLLLIDQDMVFPPDALIRLLAHGDYPIIGATYCQRGGAQETHGFGLDGARLDVSGGGPLQEAASIPCGMMLIERRVLDTLAALADTPFFRFPWDAGADHSRSEDYDLCRRARAHGFTVHVDPALSLAMGHIGFAVYQIPPRAGIGLENTKPCSETKVS